MKIGSSSKLFVFLKINVYHSMLKVKNNLNCSENMQTPIIRWEFEINRNDKVNFLGNCHGQTMKISIFHEMFMEFTVHCETIKMFPVYCTRSLKSFQITKTFTHTHTKRSSPFLWMANGECERYISTRRTRIFHNWMEHQYVCACVIMKMPHYASLFMHNFFFVCSFLLLLLLFCSPIIWFSHVLCFTLRYTC